MDEMAAGRKVVRKKRGTRDSSASRAAILQAALNEFSTSGYDGARVDRIAAEAGVSKPLLYDYFGDKDDLYAAALREAYVQIRTNELELDLKSLDPEAAIRELVRFTLDHFRQNPWFIAMLNTENLRGGQTVRRLHDRQEIQSNLLQSLDDVLKRGRAAGTFSREISATRMYLFIASLCYFPISNRFTLEAVFDIHWDQQMHRAHAQTTADILIAWLTQGAAE